MKRWLALVGFAALLGAVICLIWLLCWLDRIFRFRFDFPRDIESLAAQEGWCVARLKEAGALADAAEVTSFQVAPFRPQETLRSQMALVTIEHQEAGGQPARFQCLAKCAPDQGSLWNRTIYVLQGNCQKEVGFYNDLSGQVAGLVPRCYYGGLSEGTGHFCLLLAFLEDVDEYSEEQGCPPEAAAAALRALARIHGAFWGMDAGPHKWLDAIPAVFVELFLTCFGGKLDAAYNHRSRDIWAHCNAPQTLLHGDARVGNMLFSRGDGGAILFDWQATRLGLAACDVAYCLVLSMETGARMSHQEALLRTYHEALCEAGVEGYGWEALREDYERGCLLLGQMFGLPFLSSEISVDEGESRARALSGGLVWSRRGHAFVTHMDEAWLRGAYGIEKARLLEHTEESLLAPHPMNHGAALVAEYLRAHGGVEALYSAGGEGEGGEAGGEEGDQGAGQAHG